MEVFAELNRDYRIGEGGTVTSSSDASDTCLELTKPEETETVTAENASFKYPCAGVRLWSTIYSVLTSAMLSFLVGITLAYSSPALLELTQLEHQDFRFGSTLSDIFGASTLIGSVLGALLAGYVADKWGRKTSLALNTIPYFLGYFIILITYLTRSPLVFKSLLIIGRYISGIGVGWSFVIVPIYVSEITPAKARGFFVVLLETSLTSGVMLMFGLGAVSNLHYYDIALVPMVIVALFVVIFLWIPETPRWLLLNFQDRKRAISVLKYLIGPKKQTDILQMVKEIELSATARKLSISQALHQLFCQKRIFIPFIIAFFIGVFHQLCGVGIVTSYAGQIFYRAGDHNPSFTAFFAAGLVLTLTTIPSAFFVEVVGRKLLLGISAAGMCIGSTMLGFQFYFTRPSLCINSTTSVDALEAMKEVDQCKFHLFPLAVVSVVLFSFSFAIGVGPVSWVIVSEYVPVQVRGLAGGIILAANRTTGVIITGTYLNFSDWAGDWCLWWILAFFNFAGLMVIILFVVETKGKNLEKIPELFSKKFQYCLKY